MGKYIFSVLVFFTCSLILAQEEELQLSMEEAIDYAIKNNYDNKVAVKNIEAAKERKWETTTIGLPQINGTVDYQNWLKKQKTLLPAIITGGAAGEFVPVEFATKHNLGASVRLSQLIFDGSYLVGLQSAKTFLKISEQAKEKTAISTRLAVINAYGNVLVANKSIAILEKNKTVLDKNLFETEKFYENGLTELENVEQLQITLGTLKSNLNNANRLQKIAYQMLNLALGNSIDTKIIVTDTLENLTLENTSISLLTKAFSIETHIDYQIAQNDREGKRLLMRLEQSKALPTLSAFVNYGANLATDSFGDENNNWFDYSLLGVSLNVPIFSSFGRKSKTARARIELENADIRLDQIKQQLSLQAQTAKSEYQLSIENYEIAKKNLNLAERIEKKQQTKFFEGLSSSFDLSQAQNQLYSQQNNYVQSMLNVIAKKAQLENALNVPVKK